MTSSAKTVKPDSPERAALLAALAANEVARKAIVEAIASLEDLRDRTVVADTIGTTDCSTKPSSADNAQSIPTKLFVDERQWEFARRAEADSGEFAQAQDAYYQKMKGTWEYGDPPRFDEDDEDDEDNDFSDYEELGVAAADVLEVVTSDNPDEFADFFEYLRAAEEGELDDSRD